MVIELRTPLVMPPLGISPLRHMPTPVKQILAVHFSRRSLTTVRRRFFFHLRPPLRLPALLDPSRVVGVRVGVGQPQMMRTLWLPSQQLPHGTGSTAIRISNKCRRGGREVQRITRLGFTRINSNITSKEA